MHSKKIQFVTNCCVLHLTVIWAKIEGENEKKVSAEKLKSANISTGRQQLQSSWKGRPGECTTNR